jgi:pre-mRNA-processing factor 17
MAEFGAYPPNMAPQNALIVRQAAGQNHEVVQYTAEDLSRPNQGPANPFKDEVNSLKRKNVLTGYAEETYMSEHTFRSQHRAVERGPGRDYQGGQAQKVEAARIRAKRQKKGDATVAEGDNAYVGPWAKYKQVEYEDVEEGDELASDEEYEEVAEEDVIESGAVVPALPQAIAKRKEAEELGAET